MFHRFNGCLKNVSSIYGYVQYIPTWSGEEISDILHLPDPMWQESWGKVELLLVMRIDEPKFLVCYLEATLVYESFFEKMINYKLYIGSKMRNIVDIFFLALLFHNYVFPFYLFYSCRGIICMHFVLYTWQIGAQMKTSVAKRRQPNQRDGTYMIQKE